MRWLRQRTGLAPVPADRRALSAGRLGGALLARQSGEGHAAGARGAQALGVRHAVASAVIRPLACMDDSFKQQDYSSMLAWMVKEGACTE
ncbi:hypothetical protein LP419_38850 [Massilia sp. H-1]|nr:hypothetical protein LP419_38850 [Massilia sp. H-1]